MASYKDIIGIGIRKVSSDPPNPANGQMWYNTTTKVIKGLKVNPAGVWSTGGNLNTGKDNAGSAGTQTSAIVAGGGTPAGPNTATVETYDGSSFTEVSDLNTTRRQLGGAAADNTAALVFAGDTSTGSTGMSAKTESWNGSSWTEVGDLNTARQGPGSGGASYTSAIAIGGGFGSPGNSDKTETWNGSSWTEVGDLNLARRFMGGAGTVTAALGFGGNGGSPIDVKQAVNESWNGSSWTEVGDLNTAKVQMASFGTQTQAIACCASTPSPSTRVDTELWNGSSWSEQNNLTTPGIGGNGAGTTTAGLVGGRNGSPAAATEEWNAPSSSTVTFTTS